MPDIGTLTSVAPMTYVMALLAGTLAVGAAPLLTLRRLRRTDIPSTVARVLKPVHQLFFNKWYVDELYDVMFVKSAWALGRGFFTVGDQAIINGLGPDGLAKVSRRGSGVLSALQTGYMYHYALTMIVSMVLLLGWLALKLKGAM